MSKWIHPSIVNYDGEDVFLLYKDVIHAYFIQYIPDFVLLVNMLRLGASEQT